MIAQVASIASGLLLVPRALAYHYLPRLKAGNSVDAGIATEYRRQLRVGLSILWLCFIAALVALNIGRAIALQTTMLAALCATELIVAQASLYPSNFLLVLGRMKYVMTSSVVLASVWAISIVLLATTEGVHQLEMLFGLSIVLHLFRSQYLNSKVRTSYASYL
ncbi:hypothetical protein ACPWT1_01045 [Ramlibacter sp. MMS24-I3-19]|uniref:hypothetical protein n=1 Tax=Ramlibacter sp. MMS24-I3-19 TaxID=3416606 RepID=UPI003D081876